MIAREAAGMPLSDGLYRVVTHYLCAGFVIEGGTVTICAPILRKRFDYWATVAQPVPGAVRKDTR